MKIFIHIVMCAFVKLFYMCSNGLVFVCGLEHAFVSTQNYAQIVCKCYFSLVDTVIHICDHSDCQSCLTEL